MSDIRVAFVRAALMGSAAFLAVPAAAQTTGPGAGAIADIVVTARKREENLQTTPVAVSAFSSETLENNRLIRVDDLQKAVPSLVVYQSGGLIGTPTFSLRGITASDFIPTNENPVAIYVDGVYVARPQGALFSLGDLERVEVLRGPQGTLNGRNATAGSISLFTKNPEPEFGLSQKFSYGTFNDWLSATTVNLGALGNSGLSARVSYVHNERDGYVRNLLSDDKSNWPGALNDDAMFAAVRGQWGDVTLDYKFDYDSKVGQGPGYQITTMAPAFLQFLQNYNPGVQFVYPTYAGAYPFKPLAKSRDKTQGHSLNALFEISPALQIKSITGYRRLKAFYQSVVAQVPPIVGNVSASGAPPYSIQPIDITNIADITIRQNQFSQELQFLGEMDRLSYVLGLYYFREKSKQTYGTAGSLGLSVLSPTTGRYGARSLLDYSNVAVSKAIFGQLSYTPPILDDRMELTAGMRYTRDSKHLVQTNPAPGTAVVPVPRDVRRKDDNLSAEGSIKVQWTPDFMTYFRVAQAYKAGGISPRDTTFSPFGYEPEKVLSYELGFKADLADRRLRINADIYHSTFRNIQIVQNFVAPLCQSAVICSTTVAGGKAIYRGAEAEIIAAPVRGFELSGNVSYIDPEWKSLRTTPAAGSDVANDPGTVFSYLSKWTVSGAAQYTFYDMPTGGDLSIRFALNYHSTRYFSNQILPTNNTFAARDPGFTNLSAQVNLTDVEVGRARLAFSVYGDNLADNHQVLQSIDVINYVGTTFGPGRTFGFSVKAEY